MPDGSEEMALMAVRSPVGLVAAALSEVEAAMLELDVAVRFQNDAQVVHVERRAASIACVALDGAVEYLDGELQLLQEQFDETPGSSLLHQANSEAERAVAEGRIVLGFTPVPVSFLEVESKLLALAGLGERLAERHVRGALGAFDREDWSYDLSNHTYHQAVMTRLERGRDAVCSYAETLEAEAEAAARALASRRRMRRIAQVLGGVLITGVNSAATLMLGPVAAAASSVIGAAATSVVDIAAGVEQR